MMGILYLVATPIGNLEDITLRALRVLREVRIIAAEDTRRTRQLITHFDIHTPLISYFEHNEAMRVEKLLEELNLGDVAIVSDGGTPTINDPGYDIIQAAINHGVNVSPIPGACAPISALIVSGLPTNQFLYLGYVPRKSSDRTKIFHSINTLPYTLVFLESPHRLVNTLLEMEKVIGNRTIGIARELTKIHEEIFRGNLEQAIEHFSNKKALGEFTIIVQGKPETTETWTEEIVKNSIILYLAKGKSVSEIAAELSGKSKWKRKEIYNLATQMKRESTQKNILPVTSMSDKT